MFTVGHKADVATGSCYVIAILGNFDRILLVGGNGPAVLLQVLLVLRLHVDIPQQVRLRRVHVAVQTKD